MKFQIYLIEIYRYNFLFYINHNEEFLLVADSENHKIRKVTLSYGVSHITNIENTSPPIFTFETSYNLNIRLDTYDNVIQDLQYDISFNSPEIVDNSFYPVLPLEHVLDENDVTFLNMVLAINDPDGRQDIEFVKFYIKKVSFFNGSLVNGSCDYTFVEDNDYFWDPTWQMEYIGINDNEELIYNSQIPMNPIQSDIGCGGFGYVQFKFEVQDSKGFSDMLEIDNLVQICPGVCE